MDNESKLDAEILFPFHAEDRYFVSCADERIRQLLSDSTLTPKQVRTFARLLFGLNRLPRVTRGMDIGVATVLKINDAVESFEIILDASQFVITRQSVENKSSLDAFSTSMPAIEIDTGGYKSAPDLSAMLVWMEGFGRVNGSKLEIEDFSDDTDWDWDDIESKSYWARLGAENE